MVENNIMDLGKYKDRIPKNLENKIGNDSREEQQLPEEVILFFSFDIVNSSMYKTINYFGWATVLTKLFEKIQWEVKEGIPSAELWRVLGDEAIFIVRIKHENEIYKYIDIIFHILTGIVNDMKSGKIFKKILPSSTEQDHKLMKLQNIMSLKAAAWIAPVKYIGQANVGILNKEYENVSVLYDASNNYKIFEFLGNDIDTGFRISKKTCDRRLVVSFELAYMLAKRTDYLSRLFIITYERLKGIWGGKLYPIIWYHNKDICNNVCFEESFYYDEVDECDLIEDYFNNRENKNKIIKESYMFTDVMRALNKILSDRNLNDKINNIYELIPGRIQNEVYINIPRLELHCVAVCFNEEKNAILIAKRNNSKKSNGGKWEFGCAKASLKENFSQSVIREYKRDFSIDIELMMDSSREEKQPVPIAVYEVEKDGDLHKGIITIAKITNEIDIHKFTKNSKHDELRWITIDEVENFNEDAVPDFKATLKLAFEKIEEFKERNNKNE